ncbi:MULTISPECIES: paraquat-inducible protein A [Hyphobacterium]|uniref:Paraquat-inducible protein A n=1 Tax=Hyphobacterium vulgare TaxID=1736751 RepID=A0ABV6ZTB7_9PROT
MRDPHGAGGALARACLILAAIALPLGIWLPMLEAQRLVFFHESYSLFDVAQSLLDGRSYLLAGTVIVFSMIFPVAKLFALIWLHVASSARVSKRALYWIEMLGKWTMMDVLIAALFVFTIGRGGLSSLGEQPGVWFFTFAALMLMLASGRIAAAHKKLAE